MKRAREKEYTASDLLRDVIKTKLTAAEAAQKMWDQEFKFEIRHFRQINVEGGLPYKVHSTVWDEWRRIRDRHMPKDIFVYQVTDIDWVLARNAKDAVDFVIQYVAGRGEPHIHQTPFPIQLTPDMCDYHEIRGEIFGEPFSQSFTKQLIWNSKHNEVEIPRMIYTCRRN